MYKLILSILSIALSLTAHAQSLQDSTIYKGYLYNSEYEVYLNIDFYNNLAIPTKRSTGNYPVTLATSMMGVNGLLFQQKSSPPLKKSYLPTPLLFKPPLISSMIMAAKTSPPP